MSTTTVAPTDSTADSAALPQIPLSWARALDTGDAALLTDLLTDDVVVDLTAATTRIGLDFPVLSGRDTVVPSMIGAVGPLDTMHLVGNVAVERDGDGFVVTAYALAQHFLPGEGPRSERTRHALMGNRWTFRVRHGADGLRVARFEMDCLWFEGDPTVLLAAVTG
ncbi:nuclear transport factor 2 family protein [Jatrophihabitans sp. YIM 134969]